LVFNYDKRYEKTGTLVPDPTSPFFEIHRAGLDVAFPYLMDKLSESCAAHWLKGKSIIFFEVYQRVDKISLKSKLIFFKYMFRLIVVHCDKRFRHVILLFSYQ
jgi:hypothetical protein